MHRYYMNSETREALIAESKRLIARARLPHRRDMGRWYQECCRRRKAPRTTPGRSAPLRRLSSSSRRIDASRHPMRPSADPSRSNPPLDHRSGRQPLCLPRSKHSDCHCQRGHPHGRGGQPAEEPPAQGSTSSRMIFGRETATITATMIGTEITALTTADQYSALIGLRPDTLMPRPTTMAPARMA